MRLGLQHGMLRSVATEGINTAFDRAALKARLADLAAHGVYVGTSSWKYRGWCGMLYDEARYVFRKRFAESRFERDCLAEYSEVFKTVCVDAAYYKFPDHRSLENMAQQVPEDFRFAFKVTDEITIKKFSDLPRHGIRAGKTNENFLNAEIFERAFLKPCETIRKHVGLLMFEFSKFYPTDFERGRDFVEALDQFLGKLPKGWPYGVEIRNRNFLHPEYFEMLNKHGVAHIYNSWAEMPPVHEQMTMPGSLTSPELCGARFLLKPGRKYQEAVDTFSPYNEVKELYPEARTAGATLVQQGVKSEGKRTTFVFINNRLEGNALRTIEAIVQ
ncbi:MAG: hypothetical protein JWM16_922 [Verrucomicrobiales bacterium]|nr:hypothetical protein [Verrucomicrobiales bacterium]